MNIALERHFRVAEIAALWGMSKATITRLFTNEPGVLKLGVYTGKRKYITLSIPQSILTKVHETLTHKPFQPALPARNPRTIVSLSDFRRAVPKKPRYIVKTKTDKQ